MIIGSRFNGPPGTGNGGYSAGRCATSLGPPDGAIEVTLLRPPPLEEELTPRAEDGLLRVYTTAGDLVAEARESTVDEVVAPVAWADAVEVSRGLPRLPEPPVPRRASFAAPNGRWATACACFPAGCRTGGTAAPFVVPPDEIAPETVWAALDCPGGWSVTGPRPAVRAGPHRRPGRRSPGTRAASASSWGR